MKENNSNSEKANMLQLQLTNQSNHFNNIISDYDKKLTDTMGRITEVFININSLLKMTLRRLKLLNI